MNVQVEEKTSAVFECLTTVSRECSDTEAGKSSEIYLYSAFSNNQC